MPDVALALLDAKPDLINNLYYGDDEREAIGHLGWTPLMLACAFALPEVAAQLVMMARENIDMLRHEDGRGNTALRLAINEMLDDQPEMDRIVSILLLKFIPPVTEREVVDTFAGRSTGTVQATQMGFNVSEGVQEPVGEFMQQRSDAMCVEMNGQIYLLDADNVVNVLTHPSAIRFECTQVTATPSTAPDRETIVQTPYYVALRALGMPDDFVDYRTLQMAVYVAQHQANGGEGGTGPFPFPASFSLRRTEKRLASTISLLAFEGLSGTIRDSGVSAARCQDGQGGFVYELVRAGLTG